MIQTQVTIVDKHTIAPAWWRFDFSAPELGPRLLPGQFLLLRCADRFSCYLRRAIFPAYIGDDRFSLLLRPDPDPGLAWLSARKPGESVDVIGPLGTGFRLADGVRNLLLVSDEQAMGPLLGQMERAVETGMAVTLALGASYAATLYPTAALPPMVEFQAATLDGSLGHRGSVTDLLPDLLRWADVVCAVGSRNLYRTLKIQIETVRLRAVTGFAYGLVTESWLACGVGACLGCTIETAAGLRLTCIDGPVFDLMELDL